MARRLPRSALGCALGVLGREVTRARNQRCSGLSSGSVLAFLFSRRQQEIGVCSERCYQGIWWKEPAPPRASCQVQQRSTGESPATLQAVPLRCCFMLSPSSPELQPAARGQITWSKISQQKNLGGHPKNPRKYRLLTGTLLCKYWTHA